MGNLVHKPTKEMPETINESHTILIPKHKPKWFIQKGQLESNQ